MTFERQLLITSGGTREPIDEVRFVGNRSTGALGRAFAIEALRRGARVRLLHGEGALELEPQERLTSETFTSAADLRGRLERLAAAGEEFFAIVHAAAVADFTPVPQAGKISSRAPDLVLRLQRVPKIVDELKTWFPDALLVKFKLEVGKTEAELRAIGESSRRRSRADLIVVNDQRRIGAGRHPALILDGAGARQVDGKAEIARTVLDRLEAMQR